MQCSNSYISSILSYIFHFGCVFNNGTNGTKLVKGSCKKLVKLFTCKRCLLWIYFIIFVLNIFACFACKHFRYNIVHPKILSNKINLLEVGSTKLQKLKLFSLSECLLFKLTDMSYENKFIVWSYCPNILEFYSNNLAVPKPILLYSFCFFF